MTILFASFIFVANFLLVCYSIRKIIYIAHKKHLFDEPSEVRKIHLTKTPNLGGIAICAALVFTSSLFLSYVTIPKINYLIFVSLVLFILGTTDDLVGVNPTKKIITQLAVALIITMLAGCRITNLNGFLGITVLPYAFSIVFSSVFIVFLINAFNLIDGIDCLAGGIGLLVSICFSFYFWEMQQTGFMFIAVATAGCLGGFLLFNRTPAKIFMGDTGSMFLGFITALLSINFMELTQPTLFAKHAVSTKAPAIVLGLLIIPVFDTLRIFVLRLLQKKSPFAADRNHIHHRLLDLGFSHLQSTGILLLVNVLALLAVLILPFRTEILFVIIAALVLACNAILSFFHRKRMHNNRPNLAPHAYQLTRQPPLLADSQLLK
ncbi:MraY family glycosyltransferase [Ferruginibacter paludis]|uniref:MraY family glycosyltransferase n=1 Tax=Ferruginibacter paludis TaxID=1310417 RepID=UPI0025B2A0E5|nr:MraY family glycosyltransferase [Ferruginibacter paludis]MDN3656771.1 MraY family glycosyltransferase [Ferruginibacter paludis]